MTEINGWPCFVHTSFFSYFPRVKLKPNDSDDDHGNHNDDDIPEKVLVLWQQLKYTIKTFSVKILMIGAELI